MQPDQLNAILNTLRDWVEASEEMQRDLRRWHRSGQDGPMPHRERLVSLGLLPPASLSDPEPPRPPGEAELDQLATRLRQLRREAEDNDDEAMADAYAEVVRDLRANREAYRRLPLPFAEQLQTWGLWPPAADAAPAPDPAPYLPALTTWDLTLPEAETAEAFAPPLSALPLEQPQLPATPPVGEVVQFAAHLDEPQQQQSGDAALLSPPPWEARVAAAPARPFERALAAARRNPGWVWAAAALLGLSLCLAGYIWGLASNASIAAQPTATRRQETSTPHTTATIPPTQTPTATPLPAKTLALFQLPAFSGAQVSVNMTDTLTSLEFYTYTLVLAAEVSSLPGPVYTPSLTTEAPTGTLLVQPVYTYTITTVPSGPALTDWDFSLDKAQIGFEEQNGFYTVTLRFPAELAFGVPISGTLQARAVDNPKQIYSTRLTLPAPPPSDFLAGRSLYAVPDYLDSFIPEQLSTGLVVGSYADGGRRWLLLSDTQGNYAWATVYSTDPVQAVPIQAEIKTRPLAANLSWRQPPRLTGLAVTSRGQDYTSFTAYTYTAVLAVEGGWSLSSSVGGDLILSGLGLRNGVWMWDAASVPTGTVPAVMDILDSRGGIYTLTLTIPGVLGGENLSGVSFGAMLPSGWSGVYLPDSQPLPVWSFTAPNRLRTPDIFSRNSGASNYEWVVLGRWPDPSNSRYYWLLLRAPDGEYWWTVSMVSIYESFWPYLEQQFGQTREAIESLPLLKVER